MQLQKFDSTNLDKRKRRHLSKVIVSRTGLFRFSKSFVQAAKLQAGDKVAFWNDIDEPRNWYVAKDNNSGLTLRDGKHGGLSFNSSDLKDKILKSTGEKNESAIYSIVSLPEKIAGIEAYTIITAKNRKK